MSDAREREITIDVLEELVAGDGVAVRLRQPLQPAGGAGDKIFPPTYATGDRALKYAEETRRLEGRDVRCVLLDSVASQANRMEEALLAAWKRRQVDFPVLGVEFPADSDLADIGTITALEAPHRIADAILRDAILRDPKGGDGSRLFRDTAEGRAFTEANARNATAVLTLCPTALVFGVWDSTGPKGGLGAKFQRALASEIVAVGAVPGIKVGSRIDPLGIGAGVDVFHHAERDQDWTIDPADARKDAKGKPVPFSRGGGDAKGKPSSVNHSNVAPTIDALAGGITCDHALQTVVLSLAALRKLQFRTRLDGAPLENPEAAGAAARVALAALGLAGVALAREQGYDLRSRCLLVPDAPATFELIRASGMSEAASLSGENASALLREAGRRLGPHGLGWSRTPIDLKAAPKLVALVKRSREAAMAGAAED